MLEFFIETAKVFNNFYGTTRTPVIDKLNKSKNKLNDSDLKKANKLIGKYLRRNKNEK